MVVDQSNIEHIMRGLQSTEGVRLHNHRKKLRQRFDIMKKLGQGTYGKVQLGVNKDTKQEVAIKTIKKSKIETEADLIRIRREIQIMSSVRHPNIIHIYEVFENREKMVLVMEYAAGGELYDYLSHRKVLEETEARRIFRQISIAVYYCHKHKICHRDLKLENILLDEDGNAKIADFGLSNVFDNHRVLNTFCGSPLYASPEIVKGTPYLGPEVDCWSLGVLLYTLVYGAMPFDGSNFKRLVKQISQGDYFEPSKPSPASALIREMLTVDPLKRANIEQICSHWWVNEGFPASCLEIAEDLANQTPVRLDLLLSLVPPPDNSEKVVVNAEPTGTNQEPPPRSMSMGSLMELDSNTEQRIRDLVTEKVPSSTNVDNKENVSLNKDKTAKRKLECTASETSAVKGGAKKKEKTKPPDKPASPKAAEELLSAEKELQPETLATVEEAIVSKMEVETVAEVKEETAKPCANDVETSPIEQEQLHVDSIKKSSSKDSPKKSIKVVKKKVPKEETEELKDEKKDENKTKIRKKKSESPMRECKEGSVGKEIKREGSTRKSKGNLKLKLQGNEEEKDKIEKGTTPTTPAEEGPSKPMERRKSKIFETAEKFLTGEVKSPTVEKPKKVFIPGVKVSDFAKAFERKSSITTPTQPLPKSQSQSQPKKLSPPKTAPPASQPKEEKVEQVKDVARNIISNALVEGECKKIKKDILKPKSPTPPLTLKIGNETATVQVHSPENTKFLTNQQPPLEKPKEKKTSKVEITLKSNTLPRRTSKTEIQLGSPAAPSQQPRSIKSEVEKRVGDSSAKITSQRSEVAFPVSAVSKNIRSMSLEPELRRGPGSVERFIPIKMEAEYNEDQEKKDRVLELEGRSKPVLPYQRTLSQRSSSLSRQSTQDSDTESTMSASGGEPIRKSPREFIIPIAVEGGGYITPRATSIEPSESGKLHRSFGRKISLLSDNGSEDESPFSTLQRHSSRDEPFRMHRLRSSRPMRTSLDRADSCSGSEEEEEDDDGFEILTAENLFSTLLSRVRSLTQRLNVEDGLRPGFPSPRLLNHFPPPPTARLFSNYHHDPLVRLSDRSELGRSLSRDMENRFHHRGASDQSDSESSRSLPRERFGFTVHVPPSTEDNH